MEALESDCAISIEWLIENGLIEANKDVYMITPLGKGAALSGLLPIVNGGAIPSLNGDMSKAAGWGPVFCHPDDVEFDRLGAESRR